MVKRLKPLFLVEKLRLLLNPSFEYTLLNLPLQISTFLFKAYQQVPEFTLDFRRLYIVRWPG